MLLGQLAASRDANASRGVWLRYSDSSFWRAPPLWGPGSIAFGDQAPYGVLALPGDDPCRGVRESLPNTFHRFPEPSAPKAPLLVFEAAPLVRYVSVRSSRDD